jgi:phosphate transport system substrate-binding protein
MFRLATLSFAFTAALSLAACSSGSSGSSNSTSGPQSGSAAAGSSQSISIAGSTALLPLVKQAAADYQQQHPNAKINVSGGGSMVGITQAAQRGIDVGNSDVPAPNQPDLVDHRVAVVNFGVVVNPASGVTNLTKAQIVSIFTGKTMNFSAVGGKNVAITVVNRPRSSGTRAVFVKNLMGGVQPLESGLTQDSSGTVASIVEQTPGAISYVAKSYVKGPNIVAVSIDGVAPTDANVMNGTYPYWSYEHMFTKGQPTKAVADFIAFVQNDSTALKQLGFIPVGDMKAGK